MSITGSNRGGKREGAGRKPKSVELLQIKIASEQLDKLTEVAQDALDVIQTLLLDPETSGKERLKAAEIILDKIMPDAIFLEALKKSYDLNKEGEAFDRLVEVVLKRDE